MFLSSLFKLSLRSLLCSFHMVVMVMVVMMVMHIMVAMVMAMLLPIVMIIRVMSVPTRIGLWIPLLGWLTVAIQCHCFFLLSAGNYFILWAINHL